jgi:hypothetical protein
MEVFREEWDKIKTAYEVAGRLMPSWERMKPVALQLRELVRTQHPDLSSIALLLVIFYISFVFLVKTWRMAIGSIRFASKAVLMVLLIVFTYGCFEAGMFRRIAVHSLLTCVDMKPSTRKRRPLI